MSFGGSSTSQFKTFVSEEELEQRKKKRQEEWEKVRTADQPLECPDEEYDPKSLFERLQEQKDKRQAEYEEAHKLKNLIKGLDDDEVAFLELVDKAKLEMESKRLKEDFEEIQEYRKAVATLSEEAEKAKLKEFKKVVSNQNNSTVSKKQSNLVKVVKRKNSDPLPSAKKSNADRTEEPPKEISTVAKQDEASKKAEETVSSSNDVANNAQTDAANASADGWSDEPSENYMYRSSLQCIGVLPGLGAYSDSSDSDNSSSSDIDPDSNSYDLVGRRLAQITSTHQHS